ncbi:hypothetical protein Aduo_017605 [Ancylostoma duodenale]
MILHVCTAERNANIEQNCTFNGNALVTSDDIALSSCSLSKLPAARISRLRQDASSTEIDVFTAICCVIRREIRRAWALMKLKDTVRLALSTKVHYDANQLGFSGTFCGKNAACTVPALLAALSVGCDRRFDVRVGSAPSSGRVFRARGRSHDEIAAPACLCM